MTDWSDRGVFAELLGSAGKAKLVEAFLDHATTRVTAAEVADAAGVSESTFYRNEELFRELGVIETAGEVSGTTLYRLNRDSDSVAALAEANAHLRRQVPAVESDAWTADDREQSSESVGDAQRRVGELVPTLFTDGTTDPDPGTAAAELCTLARETPSAFVDSVPALVELLDDENDEVAVRVAAILEYVRRAFPDRFDFDRTDLVEAAPSAVTRRTIDVHDEWPFDENDRLAYASRSGPLL